MSRSREKSNPTPTLPLAGEGANDSTIVSLAEEGVKSSLTPPPAKGEAGRGLRPSKKLHNQRSQISNRRQNRRTPTEPEKLFWSWVRGKQLGYKFRRQHGIGQYIVDFYCAELQLIIELDGDSHYSEEGIKSDSIRTAFLEAKGFSIIRLKNSEVMKNKHAVLAFVMNVISKSHLQC